MEYIKLAAASIALMGLSAPAMSADLSLSGTVAEVCEVGVVSGSTSSVNIAPGTTLAPIGAIEVTCNLPGFTLTVDTANSYVLQGQGFCVGSTVNYQLGLSTPFDPSATFNTTEVKTFPAFDASFAAGQTINVTMNPGTGAATIPGGCTLTDTVTFEVGPL